MIVYMTKLKSGAYTMAENPSYNRMREDRLEGIPDSAKPFRARVRMGDGTLSTVTLYALKLKNGGRLVYGDTADF